ncbi:hypothetical protein LSPH24S_00371 [Lysinibacillus sphaericus]
MKKMKSTLLSLLIAGSVINPVYATAMNSEDSSGNDGGQEKFRVYVETNKKSEKSTLKNQYSVRWELTENGFSTDMNEKQFEALQKNKNFTVTKVPIVTLDTIGLEDDSMVENETLDLVTSLRASQQIPWGIKAIYNNDTLTSTTGGSDINIAVLDTGVNTSHPDLVNNVEQCKDFTGATTPINNSCTDRNGHGTHVAGTALADGGSDQAGVYGVAPNAEGAEKNFEDVRIAVDQRGVGLFGVQHPGRETGRDRGGPLEAEGAEGARAAEPFQQKVRQARIVQRVVDGPPGQRSALHPADQGRGERGRQRTPYADQELVAVVARAGRRRRLLDPDQQMEQTGARGAVQRQHLGGRDQGEPGDRPALAGEPPLPGQPFSTAVLRAADQRLTEVRKAIPDTGALVIAPDQDSARAYAKLIREMPGSKATVVLSDDAGAPRSKIDDFQPEHRPLDGRGPDRVRGRRRPAPRRRCLTRRPSPPPSSSPRPSAAS